MEKSNENTEDVYKSENSDPSVNLKIDPLQDNNSEQLVIQNENTVIAFAREITKRLEIEKRYEYDILKLKLDHHLEFKTKHFLNFCILS